MGVSLAHLVLIFNEMGYQLYKMLFVNSESWNITSKMPTVEIYLYHHMH